MMKKNFMLISNHQIDSNNKLKRYKTNFEYEFDN